MISRRRFMSIVSVASVGALSVRTAAAAKLEENDPTAIALGYKADASKVDAKKYPAYKAGNTCANCTQYTAKASAASGPCGAFGGKDVAAKGWCMAWVKKA